MSNTNDRPMYYSKIRVDPSNPDIVYLGGAPAFKSVDGGKTFNGRSRTSRTATTTRIWINPKNATT